MLRRVVLLMELHLGGTGCRNMGSHSVTCHTTQANTPRLMPSQRPVLELCTPEGWEAELT